MQIQDVSPARGNTSGLSTDHSATGRMVSIVGTSDGKTLYVGSFANIWTSGDGGDTWDQLTWPQPADGQFGVPGSLGGWCVLDMALWDGWSVDRNPRFVANLTRDRKADIAGFRDWGVWTATGNGDGSFRTPQFVIPNFGYQAGGWRVDKHPRFLADLTGDGTADVIGFGNDGIWTALNNGDGTFQQARFVFADFGYNKEWRVEKHPRFMADLSGDGRSDFVGFGDHGIWTALSAGDGSFQQPRLVVQDFGYVDGGWRVEKHVRVMADLTGDRKADFVGFGDQGVWTALSNGDGTFKPARLVILDFGYTAGGWRVEKHPRMMADLTGDGKADFVGFGEFGVWTALSNGDGTFQAPRLVVQNFGYSAGAWRIEKHPRFLADLTGDGKADIIGFGDDGVWTALSNGDGTFQAPRLVLANFGYNAGGWRVENHPRFLADLRGNGRADIVGFGNAGVWVALSNGDGTFAAPAYVSANFGLYPSLLALTRFDREQSDAGLWRSGDGGGNWQKVVTFPTTKNNPAAVAQIVRAAGSDHFVYVAGESAVGVSRDGGVTFQNVVPPMANNAGVYHVAAAPFDPNTGRPPAVYALGQNAICVSLDGGASWIADQGTLPQGIGAPVSTFVSSAPSVMVVSPQSPFQVFLVTNNGRLFRGDYTGFAQTKKSQWTQLPSPPPLNQFPNRPFQDSGCVFVMTTAPGQGDLIYLNPMSTNAFVAPLNPATASAWHKLDTGNNVHVDLHGMLLSADFAAAINNGTYTPKSGFMWVLSDGGVYKSTDGGQHFTPASRGPSTLSAVNVAGVSKAGAGPALSYNTGDNDGFYSSDGGAHWKPQDYGGGDNDCSYADPLRAQSMLIFTPRRGGGNGTVTLYETSPGSLPDASSGTGQGHVVSGPPFDNFGWNASSGFGERGFRPIVLNMPGDDPAASGDYIFVRFTIDRSDPKNPKKTRAVLLRTRQLRDVAAQDWANVGPKFTQQGPDLPDVGLAVVQAAGGHGSTVFYAGGNGAGELWKWTAGMSAWQKIVPSATASAITRFFVNPYNPQLIYIADTQNVKRSDDGGQTWQVDQSLDQQLRGGGRIPINRAPQSDLNDSVEVVLTDMQFDPNDPLIRFAIGEAGAFCTIDGANWSRLYDTGAVPSRPMNCYYDWISNPTARALYVSCAGRGLLKLSPLPARVTPGVTVPSVTELPVKLALQTIRTAGLKPVLTGPSTPDAFIVSQSPVAGTKVPSGSTVKLVSHKGPIP